MPKEPALDALSVRVTPSVGDCRRVVVTCCKLGAAVADTGSMTPDSVNRALTIHSTASALRVAEMR
jgi:hypothetical protein